MSESGLPGRSGEFFALLEELRVFRAGPLAADPADRALARAAGVSPTTIGAWLRGGRFPQDIGQVLAVVRAVRQVASRRGVAAPGSGSAGLLDEDLEVFDTVPYRFDNTPHSPHQFPIV